MPPPSSGAAELKSQDGRKLATVTVALDYMLEAEQSHRGISAATAALRSLRSSRGQSSPTEAPPGGARPPRLVQASSPPRTMTSRAHLTLTSHGASRSTRAHRCPGRGAGAARPVRGDNDLRLQLLPDGRLRGMGLHPGRESISSVISRRVDLQDATLRMAGRARDQLRPLQLLQHLVHAFAVHLPGWAKAASHHRREYVGVSWLLELCDEAKQHPLQGRTSHP